MEIAGRQQVEYLTHEGRNLNFTKREIQILSQEVTQLGVVQCAEKPGRERTGVVSYFAGVIRLLEPDSAFRRKIDGFQLGDGRVVPSGVRLQYVYRESDS